MKRKRTKQLMVVALGSTLVVTIIIAVCNILVVGNAKGRTFDNISDVPAREIGLLLGTSPITPSGEHNYYFDNRIKATADLYHAGKIRRILVSGGDYTMTEKHGCDEPTAMRDSLVAHNVPDTCIIEHWQGWRTINSIDAVRNLYNFDSITIISQKYHNERALYQADLFGLDAVGYNAKPLPITSSRIRNVPDTCIIEHWQGWRTINSIDAVRNLYNFDSITIISQKYHNERALYQADLFGLDAVGYNAKPLPITSSRIRNAIREYFARVKLFLDFL